MQQYCLNDKKLPPCFAPQIQPSRRGTNDPESCRGRDLAAITIAAEPSKAAATITPIPTKPRAVTVPSTMKVSPIRKDRCASPVKGVKASGGIAAYSPCITIEHHRRIGSNAPQTRSFRSAFAIPEATLSLRVICQCILRYLARSRSTEGRTVRSLLDLHRDGVHTSGDRLVKTGVLYCLADRRQAERHQ